MRLIIRPNASSVSEWVSRYVVKRIKDFAPTAEVRRPFSNNFIRFRHLIKSLLPQTPFVQECEFIILLVPSGHSCLAFQQGAPL